MNKSIWCFQPLPPSKKTLGDRMKSQGLNHSLVVDTIIKQQVSQGRGIQLFLLSSGKPSQRRWLWAESWRINRRLETHQGRESRTSRQMERHQCARCLPFALQEHSFFSALSPLVGLSLAKEMLKMPMHYPCRLGLTFCLNSCGILVWPREREKGRERERSSAMCLFSKGTNPIFRAPLPWPDYLSKAPPPNTITKGIRASMCERGVDGDTNSLSQQVINKEPHPACSPELLIIPALSQKPHPDPSGKQRWEGYSCLPEFQSQVQTGHFRHFPRKDWNACPTQEGQDRVSHKARACGLREAAQKLQCSHSPALASSWPWSCGIFPDITRERYKDQNNSTQDLVHIRTWGAC